MQIARNSHDNFFRTSLSNIAVAKDFFQNYLPVAAKQHLDFDSLQLQSGTYVEQTLKNIASDILYKIDYMSNKDTAYLYVLAEHQSTVDFKMPFRLLRYIVAIWSEHFKNNAGNHLPLVIPLVFYNGAQKYVGPTDLRELIDAPEALIEKFLFKPFHLIDTQAIADEELQASHGYDLMAYVMKHIFERDVLNCIEQLSFLVKSIYARGDTNYVASALQYFLCSAKIENPRELLKTLTLELDEEGVIMNSVFDYWESQRKETWIKQGMQQGEIAMLTYLLERKFKVVPDHYRKQIAHATSDNLLRWCDMAVESKTLEEVFASEA